MVLIGKHGRRTRKIRRIGGLLALATAIVLTFSLGSACGGQCPTPQQRAYFDDIDAATAPLIDARDELSRLFGEASERLALFFEDAWKVDVRRQLGVLKVVAENMTAISPATGARFIHTQLNEAGMLLFQIVDLNEEAIETLDSDTFTQAAQLPIEFDARYTALYAAIDIFCD